MVNGCLFLLFYVGAAAAALVASLLVASIFYVFLRIVLCCG